MQPYPVWHMDWDFQFCSRSRTEKFQSGILEIRNFAVGIEPDRFDRSIQKWMSALCMYDFARVMNILSIVLSEGWYLDMKLSFNLLSWNFVLFLLLRSTTGKHISRIWHLPWNPRDNFFGSRQTYKSSKTIGKSLKRIVENAGANLTTTDKLIVTNGALFVAGWVQFQCVMASVDQAVLNWAILFFQGLLLPQRKRQWIQIDLKVARGETYRLFTSLFMHNDLTHLTNNCVTLCKVGPEVRKTIITLVRSAPYSGTHSANVLFCRQTLCLERQSTWRYTQVVES